MRRAGNTAGCGRDREKHNVTEAMVQIRERSRRARPTGRDGEDSCDHVQNTARRVVSSAPSRRSSWQSACLQEWRTARHPQELAGCERSRSRGHQGRENSLRHCFSHSTERTVRPQSDPSLTTASASREKETQDSSKSEAEYLNDTLKRANLT